MFKWIAALSMDLGPTLLPSVVPIVMPALQRETNENNPNTGNKTETFYPPPPFMHSFFANDFFISIINVCIIDSALKSLAQEVLDIMRKILGVETYTQLFAKTHKEQYDRKESRKRKDAVEVCIYLNDVYQLLFVDYDTHT